MSDLVSAAESGNRRETLVALRDSLARTIDACESGRDMAALSKRLMEVMDEIDSLPEPKTTISPLEVAINATNATR